MCDRECICKNCKNSPCGICKYNEKLINKCRSGGIDICKHFKKIKELKGDSSNE